jgi:putative hydrolase of the HAD superfamily
MPITTLLIDLDDTVYPPSTGMWDAIAQRIDRYMHERMGIPAAMIPSLRHELHARFGTTLRGLVATRGVDEEDYLAFVHAVPLEQYLRPDPSVRAGLLATPGRKWIFTNADRSHADRVLTFLELSDLFDGVVDIRAMSPFCKPNPEAYLRALQFINAAPSECLFIDDYPRNLIPAQKLGINVLRVGHSSAETDGIPGIASLADLPVYFHRITA